ncbi:WYL domain-containing protein [Bacillus pseudomycoides]|nr:WYL domain-containing protein [Bacillus pseudomycoides]
MGLYVYNGYWYCPSYCRMRRDIRLFRVDRIKKRLSILTIIPEISI